MGDIQNPRLLYAKGALFVCLGLMASAALILEHPEWRTVALLALAVWAFARAYYFAFYVIEHDIDPGHRYAGLLDFVRYRIRRGREGGAVPTSPPGPAGEDQDRG